MLGEADSTRSTSCPESPEATPEGAGLPAYDPLFRVVAECCPVALFLQQDGRFLYLNPAAATLFGAVEPANLVGRPVMDRIHPDCRETVAERIRDSLDKRVINARLEEKYLRLDGTVVDVEVTGTPVTVENRPAALVFAYDLTHRKAAVAELEASREMFSALFNQNLTAIALCRWPESVLEDVNPAWEELAGLTRQQALGRCVRDLRLFTDSGEMQEVFRELESRGVVENRPLAFRAADGALRTILWSGRVATFGGTCRLFSSAMDVSALREAENALRESRNLLSSVLDRIHDGFVALDQDWRYTYVNRRAAALLQRRSPEELLGRHIWTEYPEAVGQPFHQAYEKAMETQQPVFLEDHYGPWDLWFENRIYPSPEGISIFFSDITERKKTEAALRRNEADLLEAQRLARLGSWEMDIRTLDLQWSPEMCRLFGVEPGVTAPSHEIFRRSVLPEEWEKVNGAMRDTLEKRAAYDIEHRLRTADGRTRHVHARGQVVCDAAGRPVRVFGTVQDITERKQAELALQASQAQLQAIAAHAPDVIMQMDLEGRVRYVNRLEAGCRTENAIGRDWLQGVCPEDRTTALAAFGEVLAHRRQVEFVSQAVVGAETQARYFRYRLNPILEGDTPSSVIAFVTDITEQKRLAAERRELETQVQRAQKMDSLGSLASGVAHDMNNVLGAILGIASAFLEEAEEDGALAQALETITKACSRGRTLVRGLLDFSRKGLSEEHVLDPNALIGEVARLLARTTLQRVRLETDLEPELRPVLGDPGTLSHALMNLCVNAVDAMPDGGTLTIRSRNLGAGEMSITVEDTGHGMPPEVVEKAMEPFFTTKPSGQGTGLGLSIVYGAVKAHCGRMDIQSTVGEGTRVNLYFPVCEPAAVRPPKRRQAVAAGAQSPFLVLVVDDDDLVLSSLETMLGTLGLRSVSAACGEEALEKLAGGLRPDLVVLDLNMPGLGGTGTLPKLRALQPELPVLLVTGRTSQAAEDLAETYKCVGVLAKPFTIDEFRKRLVPLGPLGSEPAPDPSEA